MVLEPGTAARPPAEALSVAKHKRFVDPAQRRCDARTSATTKMRFPALRYLSQGGIFSSAQIRARRWRERTTAACLPCTSTSAASARVL